MQTTQRATQALKTASKDLNAQVIVVSPANDPSLASSIERSGAEFIAAPVGCTRAEMCDLGMSHVSGTIVAVRDDYAVGDGVWLDAYRGVLPKRQVPPAVAPIESVVMDTLVAARAALADGPADIENLEPRGKPPLIEMAEAV